MGVWSDYCLICGGPFRNTYDNEDGEEINDPKFEWLNYSYLITYDEKKIETRLVDCGKGYNNDGAELEYNVCPFLWDTKDNKRKKKKKLTDVRAICCHRTCHNLLNQKLGYDLKFSDVFDKLCAGISVLKDTTLYGKMTEYSFGQDFEEKAYTNESWLLEDPFYNKENEKRIMDAWKSFLNKL